MLAALASLTLTSGFSCPPTTLENLRPKLSEFLGAEVRVGAELRDEVIVIEAENASPEEIKTKLADIVCGRWEVGQDGTLRLQLDAKVEERRRQEVIDSIARLVGMENDQLQDDLAGESLGTPDSLEILAKLIHDCEDVNRAYANFPLARIANELYLEIPEKLIAEVRFGGIREFSTKPASGQIDLGDKARRRLRKAISDNRKLYEILKRMKWTESMDNPWMESLTADLPDDAILDIIISKDGFQIDAGLHHKTMTSPMAGPVFFPLNFPVSQRQCLFGPSDQIDGSETWSRFSQPLDLTAFVEETFRSEQIAVNKDWMAEPLDSYTKGFFRAWSQDEQKPLIGRLSDKLFWPYIFQRGSLATIWDSGGMKAEEREGWIELRPLDDRGCRLERVDRDAMRKMARAVHRGKLPDINEQLMDQNWLKAATRGSMAVPVMVGGSLPPVTNHLGYGSECIAKLSEGTRRLISEGGRVPWQGLPLGDRKVIEEAVKSEDFMNREILRNGSWGHRLLFAFTIDEDSPYRFWENLEPQRAIVWAERTPCAEGQIVLLDEVNEVGVQEKRIGTLSVEQAKAKNLTPIGWSRNEEAVLIVQISETHRVKFRLPLWEGEFKTKRFEPEP